MCLRHIKKNSEINVVSCVGGDKSKYKKLVYCREKRVRPKETYNKRSERKSGSENQASDLNQSADLSILYFPYVKLPLCFSESFFIRGVNYEHNSVNFPKIVTPESTSYQK